MAKKRLIWDEDAKRHLIALAVGHHTEMLHIDMILNAILHCTPTVDAVEVVRCKDCIYFHMDIPVGFGKCSRTSLLPYPEDFCSYGERRTNGDS